MAIKMDNHEITTLELHGANGQTVTKQLTEDGVIPTPTGKKNITDTAETDVTNYASAQVVDANLVPENIKKDVAVLGIVGTHDGGSAPTLQEKTATANGNVTPDAGYDGLSKVIVNVPGGSDIAVEALSVVENGTYVAPSGKAYSPVVVDVGGGDYPDEYVTDGLYFCLDAINNAGDHHDADATSWVDTVGGIEFTQMDSEAPEVGENYIYFDGTNKRLQYTGDIAEPAYVEAVVQLDDNTTEYVIFQYKSSLKTKLGMLSSQLNGFLQLGNINASPSPANEIQNTIGIGKVFTFGGAFGGGMINGKLRIMSPPSGNWTASAEKHIVGGYIRDTYPMNGYICAIRYYNRILTEAEIAQNFAQDKKRFGVGEDITGGE